MSPYIGHPSQLYGVEEHRLVGGKGDGMRLFEVNNGNGIHMTVSVDRALDIARLYFKGINIGFFSPVGYVSSGYYDEKGLGFLKSFTAGFLTTCGLANVGVPCAMDGEEFGQHGSIGNTPADHASYRIENEKIIISGRISDEVIFGRKLALERQLVFPLHENVFYIRDTIVNEGDKDEAYMLLYHINMGYPLLSEKAELSVSSDCANPRDERAAEGKDVWNIIEKPQAGFREQCYFHTFSGKQAKASIVNREMHAGISIEFDPNVLPCMTEWKMMGVRDYVMGIEPGTCYPIGREEAKKEGSLPVLKAGEEKTFEIKVSLFEA
ncbi:MAG: aldose 1-epimerase family protein [Clostridia bacterium]|nr:aldose 1-epimerase family protein [Clostridia bacterium]MBQ4159134.1 aldose 1-epimerase family protein [Clostridia bacterium]